MVNSSIQRIDFHIHTISTSKDSEFVFSKDNLCKYIEREKLTAIAITNHNMFDINQFLDICESVNIPVFPGIEVDLEGGHVLVIAPLEEVKNFEQECDKIKKHFDEGNENIDVQNFLSIFSNLDEYLLIPHYKKKPELSHNVINILKEYIVCGEVSSSKKWFSCSKDSNSLTPVVFSDIRIKEKIEKYPNTLTYVKCDDLTVSKLKLSLKDKTKVHINRGYIDNEFQILSDGTSASNNLNIIMGLRSSGKTYTLDSINASFSKDYVKYIRQFEIVKTANDKNFDDYVKGIRSESIEKNLSDIKILTQEILKINIQDEDSIIDNYLVSLKEYADNYDKNDEYSKCKLFNCELLKENDSQEIDNIISSLCMIIDNKKYKEIIEKRINYDDLFSLLYDLIEISKQESIDSYSIKHTNEILNSIKYEFTEKSALTPIGEFDIESFANKNLSIKEYNRFIIKYRDNKIINEEEIYRFKIVTKRSPFSGAEDVKESASIPIAIKQTFKDFYNNPYLYIVDLKNKGVNENELYKTLIKIDFNVLNTHDDSSISGGERAEYVLYEELKNATKYDLVLIDEPESSFDNIFLKDVIINKIKELSKKTTVFLTTHNSTLGLLMNPDKIIYTRKIDNTNYKVYTGSLSSKNFVDANGESLASYETLMNVMESGEQSYIRKGKIYESIKN